MPSIVFCQESYKESSNEFSKDSAIELCKETYQESTTESPIASSNESSRRSCVEL